MSTNGLIEKFIYSCSHDLRAPVASIQGLVRIAEYYPHHEETHKCLQMIEACTDTMDKLIRTMEEYLINNHHTLKMAKMDMNQLMQEVELTYKNQLYARNITLTSEIKSEIPWTMDLDCVSKILNYLVSNAIAFHDQEKADRTINIKIESTEMGSTIEVSDNGVGIPEDQSSKIFDIFFRGTEDSIGAGMGLFLTKSMVDKMGGEIVCRSVVKKGTTFIISFQAPCKNL